jgi:STE24 endopeptidase
LRRPSLRCVTRSRATPDLTPRRQPRGWLMREPRTVALVAAIVLYVAFAVTVVVTTPWRPMGDVDGHVAVDLARDFSPSEHAREDAYHRAVRPPAYLALALGLVFVGVLGFTPLGARLVELVARPFGGGWVWHVLLGGFTVLLLGRLLTLPLSAWNEVVQRRYGLSTRNWAGWASDLAKTFALSVVLTLVVLLVLFALIRAMPRWWWIPAATGSALLVVLFSFVYPVVVEPIFNKFTPMQQGELRTSLLALAERDGVAVDDVLVADASRRTSTLNAYVSGFGATRRIVVYDTLVDKVPPEQVEVVVAHELAHTKNRDVLYGTLIGALGTAAGACALGWLLAHAGLLRRVGVTDVGDGRALAFALAVIAVVTFVSGPLQNLVSRRIEERADVHSLDLTHDPGTFAQMQRSLAVNALSDLDPNWVIYAMFASHDTAPQRIALARTWANEKGEPEPANMAPGEGSAE